MSFLDVLIGSTLGLVLGTGYFYFLWLTVKRLIEARHPMRLMAASFIVRSSAAVTVFYLAAEKVHYLGLVWAIIGFLTARELLKRWLGGAWLSSERT